MQFKVGDKVIDTSHDLFGTIEEIYPEPREFHLGTVRSVTGTLFYLHSYYNILANSIDLLLYF